VASGGYRTVAAKILPWRQRYALV